MRIPIKILDHAKDLPLPAYMTGGSAGMDLYAACPQTVTLAPGERAVISCGIEIALPNEYQAQICSRSGLALKQGVIVLNSPGVIDSDYRGEIGVILCNLDQSPYLIERGSRIAQIVISQYAKVEWEVAETLNKTSRDKGGFGSTDI
ncbi:MAG: dUTP diphosphatase [Holosporales bacterium]|nr:dUTP diphosphatase [Holosporales bacterium]